MELTKKHKTFEIITYHRGVEIQIVCVTTSKKKFAELTGQSVSYINGYCHTYDLRYPTCNQNPDILFGIRGLGGESRVVFTDNEPRPLEEMKELIDKHREEYKSYTDYLNKNK